MSLQQIRRRIKSIKSTAQITKAMELVAAVKMRKAQQQALQSRSYSQIGLEIIKLLSDILERKIHPLLAYRKVQTILFIVVTSDRGLAGSYNTLVIREALKFINQNSDKKIDIVTVGKNGERAVSALGKNPMAIFNDLPHHPTFSDIAPIAKLGLDDFINKTYDQVTICYTHFVSTIRQEVKVATMLPIAQNAQVAVSASGVIKQAERLSDLSNSAVEYKFEPSQDKILDFILPRMIETNVYQAILEAIASEHSARMVAMKNATDNAKDLVGDLTLTYNSARQAKITQELLEITNN